MVPETVYLQHVSCACGGSVQVAHISTSCGGNEALEALVRRLLEQTGYDDSRIVPGGGMRLFGVETGDFARRFAAALEPGTRSRGSPASPNGTYSSSGQHPLQGVRERLVLLSYAARARPVWHIFCITVR